VLVDVISDGSEGGLELGGFGVDFDGLGLLA